MAPPQQPRHTPQMDQISAEFFALTYGAIVRQLIMDYEDLDQVNKQLDTMGYNIGVRIVDEYLAKTRAQAPCASFRDAAEAVGRHALPLFLNVAAAVGAWSSDGAACSLALTDNPLADFVELPEPYRRGGLSYCQVLAGCVRGALAQVGYGVDVAIARDPLLLPPPRGGEPAAVAGVGGAGGGGGGGGGVLELRLTLKESRDEAYPFRDDD